MDNQQLAKSVNILIRDDIVVASWRKFYDSLDIEGSCVQLQNQFKSGTIEDDELFHIILTKWVSKNGSEATLDNLCGILNKLNFNNVVEKLQADFFLTETICFELIPTTRNFIGRTKEIEQLQVSLKNGEVLVQIIGMGGVGKSELARKFVDVNKNKANGIWLNGENSESLINSIFQLAIKINVSTNTSQGSPKTLIDIFQNSISKIKRLNQFPILLIIDNVDIANQDVEFLLQKTLQFQCFTLVTSRHVGVLDLAGEIINLDVLSSKEAEEFVKNSINEESKKDISTLCNLLQCFPLALQQAIAYIRKQKLIGALGSFYKIQNYLNEYETSKAKVLDFPLNPTDHKYRKTTLMTWNISIAQIMGNKKIGKLAFELLNLISYCEADGIPVELIEIILADPVITKHGLELLKVYSLIKIENEQISIHRLVQEVVQLNCASSYLDEQLLQKSSKAISGVLHTFKQNHMPHILSLWKHASKHDILITEFADLSNNIINRLRDLSLHREILNFSKACHGCLVKVLGKEHLETLKIERQIAKAIFNTGMYQDGIEKYQVILEKHQRLLGAEHECTLTTSQEMAFLLMLHNLSRLDEALSQLKIVLELRQKVFGENHESTMGTKHHIASALLNQGKIAEAIQIYEQVLEWQTTQLGPEHSETLTTRHSIAHTLFIKKEFQKAKETFQQVLKMKVKVHGDQHFSTLCTKYLLALTLDQLGEQEEALEWLSQVSTSYVNILGKEHPATLSIRFALATILCNELYFIKAKEILEENLKAEVKLYGEENHDPFITKSWIANTFDKLSESDHEVEFLEHVLDVQKKILGPKHDDTIKTQSKIDQRKYGLKFHNQPIDSGSQRCILL